MTRTAYPEALSQRVPALQPELLLFGERPTGDGVEIRPDPFALSHRGDHVVDEVLGSYPAQKDT